MSADATTVTRNYYNSSDADEFYYRVWGGEDIHIGIYESATESIDVASRRTVSRMAEQLPELADTDRLLDLGSGFGGTCRQLAQRWPCSFVAINLSDVENQRHRSMNVTAGVTDRIDVIDGAFEDLPIDDQSITVAWSNDAILHSTDRGQVLAEVSRVLRPGGHFVFTDPMQADDCPDGVLKPILDRIHLQSLGSPGNYRREAEAVGLRFVEFIDLTDQLTNHYARVLEVTKAMEADLVPDVSADYLARMKVGLQHWVDGGKHGYLRWGIFHFER